MEVPLVLIHLFTLSARVVVGGRSHQFLTGRLTAMVPNWSSPHLSRQSLPVPSSGPDRPSDRIVYPTGATGERGEVHTGNTVTDSDFQERDRGITIFAAVPRWRPTRGCRPPCSRLG
ncbi:hypothetical protein ABZX88_22800 [Kitasatospora aureofaciens]|uniref:hypothetical protein n=1 Tax=Kitasatospora aureofaciens TaxID=1894 RepID=UPI0033AF2EBB